MIEISVDCVFSLLVTVASEIQMNIKEILLLRRGILKFRVLSEKNFSDFMGILSEIFNIKCFKK